LKKALVSPPDLDGAKAGVQEKAVSYSQTTIKIAASLQALAMKKGKDHDILEKIWPVGNPYSAPKTRDEDNIGQSGEWFLNSAEYKNWVGQGPNTLICTGQGKLSLYNGSLTCSGIGKIPHSVSSCFSA
jgi:hypothetical protein